MAQCFSHGPDGLWQDPEGLYVEFSDYEQLQGELEAERELHHDIRVRAEDRLERLDEAEKRGDVLLRERDEARERLTTWEDEENKALEAAQARAEAAEATAEHYRSGAQAVLDKATRCKVGFGAIGMEVCKRELQALLDSEPQKQADEDPDAEQYPCICAHPGWGFESIHGALGRPCLLHSPEYRPADQNPDQGEEDGRDRQVRGAGSAESAGHGTRAQGSIISPSGSRVSTADYATGPPSSSPAARAAADVDGGLENFPDEIWLAEIEGKDLSVSWFEERPDQFNYTGTRCYVPQHQPSDVEGEAGEARAALEEIQGDAYLWQISEGPWADDAPGLVEHLRKVARRALDRLDAHTSTQPDVEEPPTCSTCKQGLQGLVKELEGLAREERDKAAAGGLPGAIEAYLAAQGAYEGATQLVREQLLGDSGGEA